MQLPRRVPWTSIAELDQVCAWIYEDENDLDSKILAVNKLTAWKVITALPHAIESTLAFLVVFLDDSGPNKATFSLSLRQNYAAAVIRLVNGLVDPLQLGAYARSIASISHQLGLPLWLVELRHASTHEDLPSLELLREGARQLWSPLLIHLQTAHPNFASVLVNRILSCLLSEQDGASASSANSSFHACLARWAKWVIDTWDRDDPDTEVSMGREAAVSLITALGPETSLARKNAPSELLQVLCDGNEDLEAAVKWLHSDDTSPPFAWKDEDMLVMDRRLETLLSATHEDAQRPARMSGIDLVDNPDFSAPGWRLLDDRSSWKPCPIGVHRDALL
ncbi:Las1-like-domain-containing protein [Armillaria borealis]|uniref:Las1-like-domain-containing protein n=1 Tax=Armillaria borealis TaxID=47425 RepID=A0AA39N3U5_9AGAR|nr:Las1-like-domain-containing protein [Armillaria borealis]